MDALSDILKIIQLSVNTYFLRGVGRWNMQCQYRPQGLFYLVLKGQCYFRQGGSEDLQLMAEGDILALPTGGDHWLCDSPEGQNLAVVNVTKVGRNDDMLLLKTGKIEAFPTGDSNISGTTAERSGGEKETKLFCGILSYDTSIEHPFLKDLPCFIRSSTSDDGVAKRIGGFLNVLEKESMDMQPGSTLMVDRLTEMLTVHLLRAHMLTVKDSNGYMAALFDPKIGQALNLIHREAGEKWTVDSLGKAAGLNRTSFTEKFVEMVGSKPKAYLMNTRLQKAKNSLQRSNDSMLSIAESAGYSSEAAFSKAIKKHFNRTPGQIRRG